MQNGDGPVGQVVALDSSFSPGEQSTPKKRRNRGRGRRGRVPSGSKHEEYESNEDVDIVTRN